MFVIIVYKSFISVWLVMEIEPRQIRYPSYSLQKDICLHYCLKSFSLAYGFKWRSNQDKYDITLTPYRRIFVYIIVYNLFH